MDNLAIIKGAKTLLAVLLALSISLLFPPNSAFAAEDVSEQPENPESENLSPEQMAQVEAVENELVVVYENADPADLSELNAGTSDEVEVVGKAAIVEDAATGEAVDIVTVSEGTDIASAIEELSENPKVAFVEPNYVFRLHDDAPSVPQGDDVETDVQPLQPESSVVQEAEKQGDDHAAAQSAASTEDESEAAAEVEVAPFATSTNDPELVDQYYLNSSGFRSAWDRVKCERNVSVAVIDSGCNYSLPDLEANVDKDNAYDVLRPDHKLQSTPSPTNDNRHGTAVCGAIAAVADNGTEIAGASYNAWVIPINVFAPNGTAEYGSILTALQYVESIAASGKAANLKVINMSFGAYAENDIAVGMRDKLERLRYKYGILAVSAGGNGDERTRQPILQKSYPADYDVCVSVTSLDRWGSNSTWSDYNEYKDIAAPGEGILTTYTYGGTAQFSGTSLSSPLVASAAALVFRANPSLTPTQVENALKQTATPVAGNARPQSGIKGALNVKGAVDMALGGSRISNTPMARYQVMYRMYNPNSGEHFYTASAGERDNLVRVGWHYEGTGWNAPLAGNPVYRMYNPNAGDHHYTPSVGERDNLVRVGWKYEGVGWYTSVAESQPLYRLYNPNAIAGAHHYTLSAGEATHLTFVGWRYEGIGWFGTD